MPVTLEPEASGASFPSLNYDGSTVAYNKIIAGISDVFVVGADRQNQRNLTNTPSGVGADGFPLLSWRSALSENGSAVVFLSDSDLDAGKNTDLTTEVFVAVLSPSLSLDSQTASTRQQLETFTFTGFGFTPNESVTRLVRLPNSTVMILTPQLFADQAGDISWPFPSKCATVPDTYTVWVIDDVTGRISNTVTEIVTPNGACPP